MTNVLELVAVFFAGTLPILFSGVNSLLHPSRLGDVPKGERLFRHWAWAIGAVSLVVYVASQQPNGLASVGLVRASFLSHELASLGALLAIVVYFLAISLCFRLAGRTPPDSLEGEERLPDEHLRDLAIAYTGPTERLAHLSTVALEALAEELVFRGYFMLLWGTRTGMFWPWVIASALGSVVVHLYQGRKSQLMLFHFATAVVFGLILLTTRNLLSVWVVHFVINFNLIRHAWKRSAQAPPTEAPPQDHADTAAAGPGRAQPLYLALGLLNLLILAAILSSRLSGL